VSRTRILILCTGNSCRSQMAAAFLRALDPDLEVRSAGTHPAERVHPLAVRVMREVGLDLSGERPRPVEEFLDQAFDHVITVCDGAREECPVFSGEVGRRLHVGFVDPAAATGSPEEVLAVFRQVRDEIRERFGEWHRSNFRSEGWLHRSAMGAER
jgi:arsenate reductase